LLGYSTPLGKGKRQSNGFKGRSLQAAELSKVTAGDQRTAQNVAVWKDELGAVYVLSPCGRCREFIAQIPSANMDTELILSRDRSVSLRELLPQHKLFLPHS
jgi:cytidine deaminase